MRICVLIPSFNEAKNIGGLVRKVRQMGMAVLVIDDGSSDQTFKIAEENGAIVLQNQKNVGKGASLIRGFEYILKNNFDAVITMDGDGQHAPDEIPGFIDSAENSSVSILIGNRMLKNAKMPFERILTNKFMSWVISKVARQHIPDTQCGFRLIKRDALSSLRLTTSNYETESEILVKASRAGLRIVSLPITTIYTGSKSRINPLIDTIRFLKFILKEPWITKN